LVEQYRGQAFPDHDPAEPFITPERYAVNMASTCVYPIVYQSRPEFMPWLPPMAWNGCCAGNVNIGVIAATTPYPEEAKRFLIHLTSKDVQEAFAAVPAEHPVSVEVTDPLCAWPEPWRSVVMAARERTSILHERVPGYCEVMDTIFFPAAVALFRGEMSAAGFAADVELRGNRLLAREQPPAGVTEGPACANRFLSRDMAVPAGAEPEERLFFRKE